MAVVCHCSPHSHHGPRGGRDLLKNYKMLNGGERRDRTADAGPFRDCYETLCSNPAHLWSYSNSDNPPQSADAASAVVAKLKTKLE